MQCGGSDAIREQKVDKVIDTATLTGAVITAFGNKTAGKELRYLLNSSIADIRNSAQGGSTALYWADYSYRNLLRISPGFI